jgi:hypothetical protein
MQVGAVDLSPGQAVECLMSRAPLAVPNSANHEMEEGNITAVAGSPTLHFLDRAGLPYLATLALTIPSPVPFFISVAISPRLDSNRVGE